MNFKKLLLVLVLVLPASGDRIQSILASISGGASLGGTGGAIMGAIIAEDSPVAGGVLGFTTGVGLGGLTGLGAGIVTVEMSGIYSEWLIVDSTRIQNHEGSK
jgi:hypothetical protein